MSATPYLLLEYRPANGRKAAAPALLCWFEPGNPRLFGTGVGADGEFDPVAFAGAFPADAADAWVFAEWVAAVRDRLEAGDSATSIARWVADTPLAALQPGEAGTAHCPEDLTPRLARGHIVGKAAAAEALAYLLLAESAGALTVVREPRNPAGAVVRVPDFALLSDSGVPLATLELKKQAPRALLARQPEWRQYDWHVYCEDRPPGLIVTALTALDCRARLQAWLGTLES